jgi:hypothetical protein
VSKSLQFTVIESELQYATAVYKQTPYSLGGMLQQCLSTAEDQVTAVRL